VHVINGARCVIGKGRRAFCFVFLCFFPFLMSPPIGGREQLLPHTHNTHQNTDRQRPTFPSFYLVTYIDVLSYFQCALLLLKSYVVLDMPYVIIVHPFSSLSHRHKHTHTPHPQPQFSSVLVVLTYTHTNLHTHHTQQT
jgi:hypothetical protein